MRDLPEAPALLALARDVLVNDLLPLLPAERRLEARLVANCMAIAEREAAADLTADSILGELSMFHSGERGEGTPELMHRLARELRNGVFENSPERAARARAILWRLTIARLRLA